MVRPLKKSFLDKKKKKQKKKTVLSLKKDGYNHYCWAQFKRRTSHVSKLMHKLPKLIFACKPLKNVKMNPVLLIQFEVWINLELISSGST